MIDLYLHCGQDFEAVFLHRPSIQNNPALDWLYSPNSREGVYFRWKYLTQLALLKYGDDIRTDENGRVALFDGDGPGSYWKPPKPLKYDYVTDFTQFTSQPEYESTDDEDEDEDDNRYQPYDFCLGPLKCAEMNWWLETMRIPANLGDLTKGEIACVTMFAMNNAKAGLIEIVEMLVDNVHDPFNVALERNQGARRRFMEEALDERDKDGSNESDGMDSDDDIATWFETRDDNVVDSDTHMESMESSTALEGDSDTLLTEAEKDRARLQSLQNANAHVVALYIIHDIMSNQGHSADAYKYREAFDAELLACGTFEVLSTVDRELKMGDSRKHQWRGAIDDLLKLWINEKYLKHAREFQAAFRRPVTEEKKRREEEDRLRREEAAAAKAASGPAEQEPGPQKKRKRQDVVEYDSDGNTYEAAVLVTDSEAEDDQSDHETDQRKQDHAIVFQMVTFIHTDGQEMQVPETDLSDPLYDLRLDGRLLTKDHPKLKYCTGGRAPQSRPESRGSKMDVDSESG